MRYVMSLNPSCNSVKGKGLPVIGDGPRPFDANEKAKEELRRAFPGVVFREKTEVRKCYKEGSEPWKLARMGIHGACEVKPEDIVEVTLYDLTAEADGWVFRRAWYYWCCNTVKRSVPLEIAKEFNETWREVVRVDGFAGGQDVRRDVDAYHVDTQEGLDALGALIRSLPV